MNKYFEGLYFKHQKGGNTLALIPGRSSGEAFIQVIMNDRSHHLSYHSSAYSGKGPLRIDGSSFTRNGITLDIHSGAMTLTGSLRYTGLTPIAYDIMGPFQVFPMECRHRAISMDHDLTGRLILNGQTLDFTGGKGYIEGDSGRSFPTSYTWAQCNDFDEKCSLMLSVARIPFAGLKFWGCICVVWYRGVEYRLATYRGVRILCRTENRLELKQGRLRLLVEIPEHSGHRLYAPDNGAMSRTIHESPACRARFLFQVDDVVLFDKISSNASFEHVE